MSTQNLEGRTFGRLLVLSYERKDERSQSYWLCRCVCGTMKVVRGNRLLGGLTKSCGCLRLSPTKHIVSREEE